MRNRESGELQPSSPSDCRLCRPLFLYCRVCYPLYPASPSLSAPHRSLSLDFIRFCYVSFLPLAFVRFSVSFLLLHSHLQADRHTYVYIRGLSKRAHTHTRKSNLHANVLTLLPYPPSFFFYLSFFRPFFRRFFIFVFVFSHFAIAFLRPLSLSFPPGLRQKSRVYIYRLFLLF